MYTITIADEAHDWLLERFSSFQAKMHRHPAEHDFGFITTVDGFVEALQNAEREKPAPKPKKAAEPKEEVIALRGGCEEHPLYQAKRRPRTDCEGCWATFKKYKPNHYPKARREYERNLIT